MSGAAVRLAYKPVGLLLGAAASAASAVIFRQIWKRIGGGDSAPDVRDPTRDWAEVLLAAALEGAIYAVVRAALDRAATEGIARATGDWPARDRKPIRVKVPI